MHFQQKEWAIEGDFFSSTIPLMVKIYTHSVPNPNFLEFNVTGDVIYFFLQGTNVSLASVIT